MSLNRPLPNPPFPYYSRGMVRPISGKKVPRRKKKGKRQSFARERKAEQVFKFGQVRSGYEGLTTFRPPPNRRQDPRQVASNLMVIHQQALLNKKRDDAEVERELKKKTLAIEDKKQKAEEARQTRAEARAEKQLALQERAMKDSARRSGREFLDRARLEQRLVEFGNTFMRFQLERDRRQGEQQERILGFQKATGAIPLQERPDFASPVSESQGEKPFVAPIGLGASPRPKPTPTEQQREELRRGGERPPLLRPKSGEGTLGIETGVPPLELQEGVPSPRGATTPQVREALQGLRDALNKPAVSSPRGTESPRGNVPPKRQRPPIPQRPPPSGRPSTGQDSQNKPSSLADSLQVPEPEVERPTVAGQLLEFPSPVSRKVAGEAEALKTKLDARLQYLTQLKGQAKGNNKKKIRADATSYPALEILKPFDEPSWIHPRPRGGAQFKNAPLEKGVYRFYELGAKDGRSGNTKKFNLHRDPTGKPQGGGGIDDFQLDLHAHPEHFEKLIREQKIRFKDVDEGE